MFLNQLTIFINNKKQSHILRSIHVYAWNKQFENNDICRVSCGYWSVGKKKKTIFAEKWFADLEKSTFFYDLTKSPTV